MVISILIDNMRSKRFSERVNMSNDSKFGKSGFPNHGRPNPFPRPFSANRTVRPGVKAGSSGEFKGPSSFRTQRPVYGSDTRFSRDAKPGVRSDRPAGGPFKPQGERSSYPFKTQGERSGYAPKGERQGERPNYPARPQGERSGYAPRGERQESSYIPSGEQSGYTQNRRPPQGGGRFGRPAKPEGANEWRDSPAALRFGPNSRPGSRPIPKSAPTFRQRPFPQISQEMPNSNPEPVIQAEEDIGQVNLLTGRNPIREALKTGRDLEKLMIAKGDLTGSAKEILSLAKKNGVMIQSVERTRLDQLARNHQGMIAFASAYQYSTVEDIISYAEELKEDLFIIVLDQITDPHNLGAIIRTASCAGAHGVIVPMHRAVGLTPAAVKASAGAVEHIKVARVSNLNQTIKSLQQKNIWFFAANPEGEDYRKVSFTGPCALVIGSEGEGVSKLTGTLCDKQVKIPMKGEMNSLNASVAAGILMYAVYGARN
jgi:23S rRNA (guanosine2251-2'-O)-methyltransferase